MQATDIVPAGFIESQVKLALMEDIGKNDLTAALIPPEQTAEATLVSRQTAVFCGSAWLDAVFSQLSEACQIHWFVSDGDIIHNDTLLCEIKGPARTLLSGERSAMNFLQTLSATATMSRAYAELVSDLNVTVLDTRKTLPGYRLSQKYAVRCGGGQNHRFGLYDGVLIKENHITAAGSISAAVQQARSLYPDVAIETEVENFDEYQQAIDAAADIILLDNFSNADLHRAVNTPHGKSLLEASGGVSLETIREIAETGVDRISVGALTKDIHAVDMSMRIR